MGARSPKNTGLRITPPATRLELLAARFKAKLSQEKEQKMEVIRQELRRQAEELIRRERAPPATRIPTRKWSGETMARGLRQEVLRGIDRRVGNAAAAEWSLRGYNSAGSPLDSGQEEVSHNHTAARLPPSGAAVKENARGATVRGASQAAEVPRAGHLVKSYAAFNGTKQEYYAEKRAKIKGVLRYPGLAEKPPEPLIYARKNSTGWDRSKPLVPIPPPPEKKGRMSRNSNSSSSTRSNNLGSNSASSVGSQKQSYRSWKAERTQKAKTPQQRAEYTPGASPVERSDEEDNDRAQSAVMDELHKKQEELLKALAKIKRGKTNKANVLTEMQQKRRTSLQEASKRVRNLRCDLSDEEDSASPVYKSPAPDPAEQPQQRPQSLHRDHYKPPPKPVYEPQRAPTPVNDNTSFYLDMAATREAAGEVTDLVDCGVCGRRFAADRIDRHSKVCSKNASKQRKVFDPVKMRTKGTEYESYARNAAKASPPPSAAKKSKQNWRSQHEDFVQNIRYAKVMKQAQLEGKDIKHLPRPPPARNSNFVPCPHCTRKFAPNAAERHIPLCANIKNRPPPPVRLR